MKITEKKAAFGAFLHTTTGRLVATGAVLTASVLAAVTIGAQANFTTGASGSTQITTGTLSLTVAANGANNRLNVAAADVNPGDTIERVVNLTNGSSYDLSAVTLATTASVSNLLTTDTTNGLQLKVDVCDQAWTETSNAPNTGYSYTCGGSQAAILTDAPVLNASRDLGTDIRVAGTTVRLRITMTLPGTADNTFQNLSTTIQYAFNTTQPSATNR